MVSLRFYAALCIFVIIPNLIQSSIANDENKSYMTLFSRSFNIINNIRVLSIRDSFLKSFSSLSNNLVIAGKIVYVEKLEDLTENIKAYKRINNDWILLIDNITTFNRVHQYLTDYNSQYKSQPSNIKLIVLNEKTNDIDSISNLSIPIFVIKDQEFSLIISKYTITNETENVFVKFTFFRVIEANQKVVCITISIIKTVIFLALYFYWGYLKKVQNIEDSEVSYIQCIIENLLFIMLLKSFLSLYYVFKSNASVEDDETKDAYVIVVAITLDCIVRTLICFLFYSVSKGYGIFKHRLESKEVKRLLFTFVFIYIVTFVDQVLSGPLGLLLYYGLEIKDLKNMIFLFVLMLVAIFNTYKSHRMIRSAMEEMNLFGSEIVNDFQSNGGIRIIKNKQRILM